MSKTNALRIIESLGIEYDVSSYEVNDDELDALTVAAKINTNPDQVFKTLVTRTDKNSLFVFCIPAGCELNLKKAAIISGSKSIEMIKQKELLSLTGYIRGGCSPVGMKKLYPSYLDETALLFDYVYVSAGKRGMQMRIKPDDLLKAVSGKYADLI